MFESEEERSASEREIRELPASIDQANVRRAAELTLVEKFKLSVDLYDDGIRWLKQFIRSLTGCELLASTSYEIDRAGAAERGPVLVE